MIQKTDMKKFTVILVIIAAISSFFMFDLNTYFTLENIKGQQLQLQEMRDSSPVIFSLVYFSIYVMVTALSLPGAVTQRGITR